MVKKGVVYVEYISNGVDQNVPVVALYYMLGQDTRVQKKSITKEQASNGCKRPSTLSQNIFCFQNSLS